MIARIFFAIPLAALLTNACLAIAQERPLNLETVVVIGDRVQPESVTKPLTVIDSQELSQKQATTLGETLRGVPGVAATGFGPNASRPIIRGQDGDRVKILQNSAPTHDASAMSFDHAVGVSPYALEQVEILRGPAALLYGGNAVGGVINLVNRRILRTRLDEASTSVDLRVDSSNNNKQGAFEFESPIGGDWFFHADAFSQKNGDTRTPYFIDSGEDPVAGERVRNSAAKASGLGLGLSKITGSGHIGFSLETDRSNYGVPKETDITIKMERNRIGFAADQKISSDIFERIRLRAGFTDYQHKELELASVATTFKNQANDFRLELFHRTMMGWQGLLGMQWEHSDFNIIGVEEDPLMPQTKSPKLGLFILEETSIGGGTLRLGGRVEHTQVKADRTFMVEGYGDDTSEGSITTTGSAQSRKLLPFSASLEYTRPFTENTRWGMSVSHVQRAPSNYELFAMGIHHASGLFEAGNTGLEKEKGNHLDLTFTHAFETSRFKASAFYSRYANYLTLIKRGDGDTDFYHEHEPGEFEAVPVYDYSGIGAKFYGAELEYSASFKKENWTLIPKLTYDYVIGKRTSNNAYIPRLTPQRLTPSIDLKSGPWLIRAEVQWVGTAKLGENETVPAPSHSLLNLLLQHQHGPYTWFIKGTNLTDRLAFNANTVNEVRQFAPVAGRAVQAGVRLFF